MNYELAKQLKDAGFPQPEEPTTGNFGSWTLQKTHGKAFSSDGLRTLILFPGMNYWRELVYIPTLSELMEACSPKTADEFNICWAKGIWSAMIHEVGYRNIDLSVEGNTPEEAVKKLWLELNKK